MSLKYEVDVITRYFINTRLKSIVNMMLLSINEETTKTTNS